jgi:hypothetical protein
MLTSWKGVREGDGSAKWKMEAQVVVVVVVVVVDKYYHTEIILAVEITDSKIDLTVYGKTDLSVFIF